MLANCMCQGSWDVLLAIPISALILYGIYRIYKR